MRLSERAAWVARVLVALACLCHDASLFKQRYGRGRMFRHFQQSQQNVQKFDICPTDLCECKYGRRDNGEGSVKVKCDRSLENIPPFHAPPGFLYDTVSFLNTNLTEIPDRAFAELKARTVFFRSNNFSSGINSLAFAGLEENAINLILADCQLESVSAIGGLGRLTVLRILDLEDNNITSIPKRSFAGLGNLIDLTLYRNQIHHIGRGAFRELVKLEKLKLSFNRLKKIHRAAFKGLKRLTNLLLTDNMIQELTPGTFRGLKKLRWLELERNYITVLSSRSFKGLSNLQYLKLDNNPLINVGDYVFMCTKRLVYLSLNVQNISTITENTFGGLAKLQTLYMGEMNRFAAPPGIFKDMRALKHLSILNYQSVFQEINVGYFSPKLNYRELEVYTVPLCNCKASWIRWLMHQGVFVRGYCVDGEPNTCVKKSDNPQTLKSWGREVPKFNFKKPIGGRGKNKSSQKKHRDSSESATSAPGNDIVVHSKKVRDIRKVKGDSTGLASAPLILNSISMPTKLRSPIPSLSRKLVLALSQKTKSKNGEAPGTVLHISAIENG